MFVLGIHFSVAFDPKTMGYLIVKPGFPSFEANGEIQLHSPFYRNVKNTPKRMADTYEQAPKDARLGLKTEDEIEVEACSGTWLTSYIRVARCEWKLWGFLAAIFGIAVYVYSMSRVLKDTFVISKQLPISINFIKFLVIMPMSLIITGFIQKLLSTHSVSKIFDVVLIGFALCYILVGTVLLPFASKIQFDTLWSRDIFNDEKMTTKGLGVFYPLLLIFNEWTSTVVYVVAEFYGSMVVQFLFLAFVNEILTVRQCSRFIPLFYIISNILLIASGETNKRYVRWAGGDNTPYWKTEMLCNGFFVMFGVLTFVMYLLKKYVDNSILKEQLFIKTEGAKKKSRKQAASFSESLRLMAQSRFLIAIVFNSLFYYIATNLIESAWKSSLRVAADYKNVERKKYAQGIMSWEQQFVGLLVVLVLLSPVSTLVQTHGWISVAIVPPLVTLVSSVLVFGAAFYNYPKVGGKKGILVPSILNDWAPNFELECYGGLFCVGAMKIAKYAFYDISKEAISMQIDSMYRAKFKAIYDGLCGKFGKSMGSLYGMAWSLRGFNDVRASAPVTLILCMVASVVWIYAIIYLNKKYKQAIETSSPIDIDLFSGKKDFE